MVSNGANLTRLTRLIANVSGPHVLEVEHYSSKDKGVAALNLTSGANFISNFQSPLSPNLLEQGLCPSRTTKTRSRPFKVIIGSLGFELIGQFRGGKLEI